MMGTAFQAFAHPTCLGMTIEKHSVVSVVYRHPQMIFEQSLCSAFFLASLVSWRFKPRGFNFQVQL